MEKNIKEIMDAGYTELEALRIRNNAARQAAGLNDRNFDVKLNPDADPIKLQLIIAEMSTQLETIKEKQNLDRALDEVKLLNIKAYHCAMETMLTNSTCGDQYELSNKMRVISQNGWEACLTMLYHIERTLAELLPE